MAEERQIVVARVQGLKSDGTFEDIITDDAGKLPVSIQGLSVNPLLQFLTPMDDARGISADFPYLWLSDQQNNRISHVRMQDGVEEAGASVAFFNPALPGGVLPRALACDASDDTLWIGDNTGPFIPQTLHHYSKMGVNLFTPLTIACNAISAIDVHGDLIYVAGELTPNNNRVMVVNKTTGAILQSFEGIGNQGNFSGIAVDDKYIYIRGYSTGGRIIVLKRDTGQIVTVWDCPCITPRGLTIDAFGHMWGVDRAYTGGYAAAIAERGWVDRIDIGGQPAPVILVPFMSRAILAGATYSKEGGIYLGTGKSAAIQFEAHYDGAAIAGPTLNIFGRSFIADPVPGGGVHTYQDTEPLNSFTLPVNAGNRIVKTFFLETNQRWLDFTVVNNDGTVPVTVCCRVNVVR